MRSGREDDRSTKARIRDAAIDCIAADGVAATTVRKIAEAAGVSPALVMHHFGSMEGLRAACDERVTTAIKENKEATLAAGPNLDVLGSLRDSEYGNLPGYLARVLMEDSDRVNALVDDLVTDAVGYFEQGVETGMLKPTADPKARAAVMILWSLGGLVLHHHMKRLLGVDLTAPDAVENPGFVRYAHPALDLIGSGMFTDEFNARLAEMFEEAKDDTT